MILNNSMKLDFNSKEEFSKPPKFFSIFFIHIFNNKSLSFSFSSFKLLISFSFLIISEITFLIKL